MLRVGFCSPSPGRGQWILLSRLVDWIDRTGPDSSQYRYVAAAVAVVSAAEGGQSKWTAL